MSWERRGLVFRAEGQQPWAISHAANPVAHRLSDGRYLVLVATRDARNYSHVAGVEIDLDTGETRLRPQPALVPGSLGDFDGQGVYPSSLVDTGEELLLYYTGWNVGSPAPLFYTAAGLAISRDGGRSFVKTSRAPLIGRSEVDPWMVSQPLVRCDDGRWRMWYISGEGWVETAGRLSSRYHLYLADSDDGVSWRRRGERALEPLPGETNFSRPSILREGNLWQMWFGVVANDGGYQIGYAESSDGLSWRRADEVGGLRPSGSGWDSDACTYPWALRHDGRLHLLYNGNRFGAEGLGLAVAE